jgi:hypothetical protein
MTQASEAKTPERSGQAIVLVTVGAVLAVLLIFGTPLGIWSQQVDPDDVVFLIAALFLNGLGALIVWKADGNRVGWVFSAIGLSILASGIAGILAEDKGWIVFEAFGGASWLSWFAGVALLILWFPTGRVHAPRWIVVEWTTFLLLGVTFFTYLFSESMCLTSGDAGCVEEVHNPIGIPGVPNPEYGSIAGPLTATMILVFVISIASLVLRYRRSLEDERRQIKWFLFACAIFVAGLAADLLVGLGVESTPAWLDAWVSASVLTLPIAATLAIVRYRLYDIDRLISRTVTYAVVIGIFVAIYFGLVALLTGFLPSDNPLVVAASTLAVAALFNPVRKRVQTGVDRRFNRSRYNSQRVMDEFAGTLKDRVDPNAVLDGWMGVVSETMNPASLGVWVRDDRVMTSGQTNGSGSGLGQSRNDHGTVGA